MQWLERTPFLDFENFNFWEQYRNSVDNMLSKEKDIINRSNSLSKEEKKMIIGGNAAKLLNLL